MKGGGAAAGSLTAQIVGLRHEARDHLERVRRLETENTALAEVRTWQETTQISCTFFANSSAVWGSKQMEKTRSQYSIFFQ